MSILSSLKLAANRSVATGQWENGWISEIEEEAWDGVLSEQQTCNDLLVASGKEPVTYFADFYEVKDELEAKVRNRITLPRLPYEIEKEYIKIANAEAVLRMRYQPTGDCVGNGTSRAVEALLLELWDQHYEIKPRPIHPSFIYGGARRLMKVRAGAGASVAHAAKFIFDYGVLFEDNDNSPIKPYDQDRQASGRLGRDWDSQEFSRCINWATPYRVSIIRLPNRNNMDAIDLVLDAGAKIFGGFRRKFVNSQTTRQGVKFGRLSGTWNHCVACVGRFKDPVHGYAITNSHGNRYVGECVKGTPAWATNLAPTEMEEMCEGASLYAVFFINRNDNLSAPDWRIV
jgi:hypothetical protein